MQSVMEGQIREQDASGSLLKAGFTWREHRALLFQVIVHCFVLLVFGTAVCAVWLAQSTDPSAAAQALTAFLLSAILLFTAAPRMCVRRRTLYFTSDGAIHFTSGSPIFGSPASSVVPMSHREIVSIEMKPVPRCAFGVALYYASGETKIVSLHHTDAGARIISVQLLLALQHLREEIGQRRREGYVKTGKATRPNVTID